MMQNDLEHTADFPKQIIKPLHLAAWCVGIGICLVTLWLVYAPIATTIRANGTLVSSVPSYDIQHPFGGPIETVHVVLQQSVTTGQDLVAFDVSVQRDALKELQKQMSNLTYENTIISAYLDGVRPDAKNANDNYHIELQYLELQNKFQQDLEIQVNIIRANHTRAVMITKDIDILKKRRALAFEKAHALEKLVAKGAIASAEVDENKEKLLVLDGEINVEQSRLTAVHEETKAAKLEAKRLKTDYRLSLLDRLNQNEVRLIELRRQILPLKEEIANAVVRSPIDGTIVALNFDTDRMYAGQGSSILKLSKRLEKPKVLINIPTQSIDQVKLAMNGKMTIPSLPQRNLPPINVRLTAISPDAIKDENGQPIGYQATADIVSSDLKALTKSLEGDLRLSTDMPVSVALEGRNTTFYQYLILPFFKAFSHAIQD